MEGKNKEKGKSVWQEVDKWVLIPGGICLFLVVLAGALFPAQFETGLSACVEWIMAHFKWLYIVCVCAITIVCFWLILSKYGNIRLGGKQGAEEMIRTVCFEEETKAMEDGSHTLVGTSGVRLSGGQAQRLALARTLYHTRPVLVLDDPFSALDKKTEAQIFANVKELARDSIVILISHRLYLFDQMDQVIWMDEGHTKVGTHEELLAEVPSYAELCRDQTKGGSNDEK